MQLSGTSREKDIKGGSELETRLEEVHAAKDVETESSARQGDDETAYISKMADVFGANQREDDEVVLLTLVLVHGGDFVWLAHPVRVGRAFAKYVSDQVLLAVVGSEDRDLLARVAKQPHVHVDRNCIFGFGLKK